MIMRRTTFLTITAMIFIVIQFCNFYFILPSPAHKMERKCSCQIGPEVPTTTSLKHRGPTRLVLDVDCKQIIEGDEQHMVYGYDVMRTKKFNFPYDDDIGNVAKNCDKFKDLYNYENFIVSKEEVEFPIAYSILTYKDVIQTEKLLRAIYRPHDIYCIHVDLSSSVSFHDSIKSISECFPNVFIASQLEDVIYAGYSRLQADLNCMSDLLRETSIQWKYVINLPSQVYPLKTNAEIVKILKLYNGFSSIETLDGYPMRYRFRTSFKVEGNVVSNTHEMKAPPLYNITVGKGSAYGVFSRDFVNYSINDVKAKYLLQWLEDTYSPDEFFWATLAFNKHLNVPGVLPNDKTDNRLWIAVSSAWLGLQKCKGKFVRGVCVFGIGDLNRLVLKMALFSNKFYFNYQPLALQCLEEWHFNKSFSETPFLNNRYVELLKALKKH